jgi:hypothetical protein
MRVGRYAFLAWLAVTLLCRTAAAQSEEPPVVSEGDASAEAPEAESSEPPETVPVEPPETEPAEAPEPELYGGEEPSLAARWSEDASGEEPPEHVEDDGEDEGEEEHAASGEHFQSRFSFGDPERIRFSMPGEAALRLIYQSDMELSAIPTDREDPDENIFEHNSLGQNLYLMSWVRFRPELAFLGRLRLIGQLDVLHGHLAGDDTYEVDPARDARSEQEALSVEGVRPRFLYLELDTGVGLLRLGQMGSYWGMGLLANDGDHGEDYLFGDHHFGDIVERVVFFTKPFYRLTQNPIRELAMFVGGDIVFNDGIADLVEGDLAWQIVGGLLWRLDPDRALGLYIAYRNQTYEDGDTLAVTALDFYGEWNLRLAHQIFGYAETEVVGIFGETNAAPNLENRSTDIQQLGLAARVGVRLDSIGLDIRVEGGYTSGDANTNDGAINRFTADPDYRVGLILFPELLAWSTARAAAIAGNPELVGETQDGVELLPTNGSLAGAGYVYPSVTWAPLNWLDLRFAMVVGQATSDVISPFETKRRGTPSSYRGGPATNRDLGLELDLGIYARWDLRYVQIRGGLEGAWCRPGRAFDDAEGNRHPDIGMFRTRLTLDW